MLWNELDYDLQRKVIDRVVDLLKNEDDDLMQDGIIAAVHELECWSNTPCQIIDNVDGYIAIARDPFPDDDFDDGWDL